MRLDHAIFQGPLAADVVLDGPEWPEAGDGQRTWIVQTGEEGKENDYGVVSDGHGFLDSPDCERISGGVNSKGKHAVAIGRQANMLQWGFYCAPDRMTESAKKVFLNAIVWMRRFDGERPLVRKEGRAREWLVQFADSLGKLSAEERKETGERSYAGYLRGRFPAELTGGADEVEKVRAWYAANVEYLYEHKGKYEVDADLAALRVGNRDPKLFAVLAERLRQDPADELVRRVLARYFPGAKPEAAALAALAEQKDGRLFFSDTGGYRWFVARAARPAPAK